MPWENCKRRWCGYCRFAELVFEIEKNSPPDFVDPRQEMIDMVWRKAPHARGYHGNRQLGGRRIDDHLNLTKFDGQALVDALAQYILGEAGSS